MSSQPLTDFEKQKYQNELKFNGVYSINNLSKINDGTYIINLDEYESIGTHSISFGVEHIPKEMRKFIGNKNITIIYRVQAFNSKMWFNSDTSASDLLIMCYTVKVRRKKVKKG